ncbi:AAA family ATPase [Paraburkholderia sp. UCT31]|uniref:AAA family ATPase n=1 Tax=Paraburkholderia sp. UCT31 TaxID=2615209 RepID=UPI0016564B49|nr:AAA family ATPase [Paraburkholderia sp. UCT31]MBC8737367.1 AAA family ATPase [Paraburkholderia sp. UCT31]
MHIPVAGLTEIYDVSAVEKVLAENDDFTNALLKKMYQKMIRTGGTRYLIRPSSSAFLTELYDLCPNFSSVLDNVRRSVELALYGEEPVQFTPILLTGAPGVGKTHFAKLLAKAMGTAYEFVPMSSMTAGFILSGSAATWQNARHGKVAHALVEGAFANPLLVLDELDKAGGDSRHDSLASLYQLMEGDTAAHFKDEFLDVEIDASHVLWVSTANYPERIPEPILQRMEVIEVPSPTREQAVHIANHIYAGLLCEHKWKFDAELDSTALDEVADVAPREMRKALLSAMGEARMKGRDRVRGEDFPKQANNGKRRIGF